MTELAHVVVDLQSDAKWTNDFSRTMDYITC